MTHRSGTFTLLSATLSESRFGHVAVLLLDGRVLVAGGSVISSPGYATNLDSAEIFDSTAGSFSLLPARMTTPRYFQSSENAVVQTTGTCSFSEAGSRVSCRSRNWGLPTD